MEKHDGEHAPGDDACSTDVARATEHAPVEGSASTLVQSFTATDVADQAPRATANEVLAEIGPSIQHYELIRPIGRGGMGEVFLARDTRLGRLVAIKLLRRHAGERARRFIVEARATARLSHENIVIIHEIGEHQGWPYMVLEYLRGKTLRQWLDERHARQRESAAGPAMASVEPAPPGLAPRHVAELVIPIVRALACAHERHIVHRDLKPANVVITDAGTIKVLDFGLVKMLGSPALTSDTAEELVHDVASAQLVLTATGALAGTLPYMSPEQWGVGSVDHRTDIWAVGILLAEMVLGAHPLAPLSMGKLQVVRNLNGPCPACARCARISASWPRSSIAA